MKSWHPSNSIIHDFYPSLIPGISTIVQQDFGNSYVYWIHLITYRLREYFQPIHDIRYSESLCFKYVKQIPESLLQADYKLSSFSDDEIDAAFDYAKGLVAKEKQTFIAAAEAPLLSGEKRPPSCRSGSLPIVRLRSYNSEPPAKNRGRVSGGPG